MKSWKGAKGKPRVPGSGRKKGSKNKKPPKVSPARETLAELIENIIPTKERFLTLARLARGISVTEQTSDGKRIVYKTAPSESAIKELNDRQFGKVPSMGIFGGPNGNIHGNGRNVKLTVVITDSD